jgi:ElaA protein
VFVVEQNCPYSELDGKDPECIHVVGKLSEKVVAVARIVPPGLSYEEVSVGRVAVNSAFRGKRTGRELMEYTLELISEIYGKTPVRISAQCYLQTFYESLGFNASGESYLEDGIPHIEMLRREDSA